MYRLLTIFFICAIVVLYMFNFNCELVVFAKSNTENLVVLTDKNDEQLVLICEEDLDYFLSKLNLQNYNEFFVEDRLIIEGYSSKFNKYILFDNKKINVQISVSDGMCLIGCPIIKKSF